jgi:hypothetical protein
MPKYDDEEPKSRREKKGRDKETTGVYSSKHVREMERRMEFPMSSAGIKTHSMDDKNGRRKSAQDKK